MSKLHDLMLNLPTQDADSHDAVAARAAQNLRPSGAFARLDVVAAWLAGWQRTAEPAVNRPVTLVFAGNHGVAADGVSAYPAEVTAAMLAAVEQGKATISALGDALGVEVKAFDVGVAKPTANLRTHAAMSPAEFDEAAQVGIDAVNGLDAATDLLVVGELGIANTTAAAAVAACCFGGPTEDWVGRGTGVDEAGLSRKIAVVREAQARLVSAGVTDPIEILREVGGKELVAMAAAIMAARHRSIPVVLDGFIVGGTISSLFMANAASLDHCIAGHRSDEFGHSAVLSRIGKSPLLDLNLRLGEGSGALLAVPLVKAAAASVVNVATFEEWFSTPAES